MQISYLYTYKSISLKSLQAKAVEAPVGSRGGDNSVISRATIFNFDTFFIPSNSSQKVTPPASGVPCREIPKYQEHPNL